MQTIGQMSAHYLDTQPDEILLNIFYEVPEKDLPALCGISKQMHKLCGEPNIRAIMLKGKYLNLGKDESWKLFLSWVPDDIRNEKSIVKETREPNLFRSVESPGVDATITPRLLEHLTAVVEAYPEFAKTPTDKIGKKARRSNFQLPFHFTRNPAIMDLLLRYGADPNTRTSFYETQLYTLARGRYGDDNLVIMWQLIAYGSSLDLLIRA